MVALCNRADHYIFILFILLSFFPRLISAVGDWMSTILPGMRSPHFLVGLRLRLRLQGFKKIGTPTLTPTPALKSLQTPTPTPG